jgi:hypothetical protein
MRTEDCDGAAAASEARARSNARSSAGNASTGAFCRSLSARPEELARSALCVVDAVDTVSVSALNVSAEFAELDITATSARRAPAAMLPLLENGPLLCK